MKLLWNEKEEKNRAAKESSVKIRYLKRTQPIWRFFPGATHSTPIV